MVQLIFWGEPVTSSCMCMGDVPWLKTDQNTEPALPPCMTPPSQWTHTADSLRCWPLLIFLRLRILREFTQTRHSFTSSGSPHESRHSFSVIQIAYAFI